jgi:hypothetical protein
MSSPVPHVPLTASNGGGSSWKFWLLWLPLIFFSCYGFTSFLIDYTNLEEILAAPPDARRKKVCARQSISRPEPQPVQVLEPLPREKRDKEVARLEITLVPVEVQQNEATQPQQQQPQSEETDEVISLQKFPSLATAIGV